MVVVVVVLVGVAWVVEEVMVSIREIRLVASQLGSAAKLVAVIGEARCLMSSPVVAAAGSAADVVVAVMGEADMAEADSEVDVVEGDTVATEVAAEAAIEVEVDLVAASEDEFVQHDGLISAA